MSEAKIIVQALSVCPSVRTQQFIKRYALSPVRKLAQICPLPRPTQTIHSPPSQNYTQTLQTLKRTSLLFLCI